MKNSLLFLFAIVASFLLCCGIPAAGQTIVFSENYSGFSTGSHDTPSTSDASGNLDSKTQLPGWTGSKVYSAGGEIKLGTADITGWIETPLISFSAYEGTLTIKFDICRWPGDAASVQVLLNGMQIGNTISPTDYFQTAEIPVTSGVSSGKIKFEALTKRFFLDNVLIVAQNITSADNYLTESGDVIVFPNPAGDFVTVRYGEGYDILEVSDIFRRILLSRRLTGADMTQISMADLPAGIYFIRLSSDKKVFTGRVIKSR